MNLDNHVLERPSPIMQGKYHFKNYLRPQLLYVAWKPKNAKNSYRGEKKTPVQSLRLHVILDGKIGGGSKLLPSRVFLHRFGHLSTNARKLKSTIGLFVNRLYCFIGFQAIVLSGSGLAEVPSLGSRQRGAGRLSITLVYHFIHSSELAAAPSSQASSPKPFKDLPGKPLQSH